MFNAPNKKSMVINVKKQINLKFSALPERTQKALDFLSLQKWLDNTKWYLAGGTALALSTGLRKSVDLDFFSSLKEVNNDELLENFIFNNNWRTTINKKNTVYGELFKAKVSFIAYPFFVPKQKMINYGYVRILQPIDIAVMKIITISQRGRKRDFFDLYWCAINIESLENIIKRLKVQYPTVAHDYHHILKSMIYFDDAENDPMPELNIEVSWREVKDFFEKEIPKIFKNILVLK